MGGRKIANQSNSSPEEILMAKKQLRRAIITAVFLVIGLQIAWIIAISQSAIREVNQPKSEFEEIHLFEVPNLLSSGNNMNVDYRCSSSLPENYSSFPQVSWQMISSSNDIVAEWNGDAGGDCGSFSEKLPFGTYQIVSNESDAILVQELELHIWKSLQFEGHMVALLFGIILGGDSFWRNWKKLKLKRAPLPKHKLSQKKVWDEVNEKMSEDDEKSSSLSKYEKMIALPTKQERKNEKEYFTPSFEQKEEVSSADEKSLIEEKEIEELLDLGEGTMHGLEGPLQKDESIKSVKDIWDL
ncbi:MAG: hypothetical protein HOC79_00525 [Euryarchaeota archaeon]|jgi:hypothetical protein|nr:hypothetical protein [Euryarchaeota archaeon]